MANWIQQSVKAGYIASTLGKIERRFIIHAVHIVPDRGGYDFIIVAKVSEREQQMPLEVQAGAKMVEELIKDVFSGR